MEYPADNCFGLPHLLSLDGIVQTHRLASRQEALVPTVAPRRLLPRWDYAILLPGCTVFLWPDGGGAGAAERITLARAQEQRNNPRLSLEMRT